MSEMPEKIYAAGCDGRNIAYAVSGEGWTERTTETVYIRADIAEQREAELVEAAYKEGYRDGTGCCDYGMVVDDDEHRDWLESNAYKDLAKHEKEQGDE